MERWIGPAGAATRAAVAAMAGSTAIALAACGTVVAPGHAASAGTPAATAVPGGKASAGVALCMDLSKLTRVRVARTMALRVVEPDQALTRRITITDPRTVRGLATLLCGLPKMPPGPVNCPAQFTGSLRLVFAAGQRPFPIITIQMTGCRVVMGLGPARMTHSSRFWDTLGWDLGVKSTQKPSQSGEPNP
jgi:hypothetical protein